MPTSDKSRPAIVSCELYTDQGMQRVAVRYDDHGEEDRPATELECHLLASRSAERTQQVHAPCGCPESTGGSFGSPGPVCIGQNNPGCRKRAELALLLAPASSERATKYEVVFRSGQYHVYVKGLAVRIATFAPGVGAPDRDALVNGSASANVPHTRETAIAKVGCGPRKQPTIVLPVFGFKEGDEVEVVITPFVDRAEGGAS